MLLSSTLNTKICKRILISFDAYLMLGYATVMNGGILYAVRHDERKWILVLSLATFYFTVFADALPGSTRLFIARSGFVLCWLCTLFLVFVLYTSNIPDVHPGKLIIGDSIHTSLSMSLSAAMQYNIFTMKVVFKALVFPKRFALITSQLKSIRVDIEDANLVKDTALKISRAETKDGIALPTIHAPKLGSFHAPKLGSSYHSPKNSQGKLGSFRKRGDNEGAIEGSKTPHTLSPKES